MDSLAAFVCSAARWLMPVLALWILLRCVRSMLQERYEPELWARLEFADGSITAIRHWESIIGRSRDCDIVISDDEVRYQRMLARGSERDGKSVEKLREFDEGEEKQFHTSESEKMANYVIKNDGGVEDFYAAVDAFYANLAK